MPITANGALAKVKRNMVNNPMTPVRGVSRKDQKIARKVSNGLGDADDMQSWAKKVKVPKAERRLLQLHAGQKVRTVRGTGSGAYDLSKKPFMTVPTKSGINREIKHVNDKINMGIDPVGRPEVIAHEAAHLTRSPKRMRGANNQAKRMYRIVRLSRKYGTKRSRTMEEARADAVASRKLGRTIRSGHTNEKGYWEMRHRVERGQGVKLTPKFVMPKRKKVKQKHYDYQIVNARRTVRQNRGQYPARGSAAEAQLNQARRIASSPTSTERAKANKKYKRRFKVDQQRAIANFRSRNPD